MKLFKPIGQFAIVRCEQAGERTTESGIVLAESVHSHLCKGVVVEVSDGVPIEGTADVRPMRVKPGDVVVMMMTAPPALPGLALSPAQPELRMIDEAEIVGLVTDE